jgi:hypothetical protein
MPIRFDCPACHKPLSIGTRKAGARIDCPRCHDKVIVPAESNTKSAVRIPVAQPAAPPASLPSAPVSTERRRRHRLILAVVGLLFVGGPLAACLVSTLRARPEEVPQAQAALDQEKAVEVRPAVRAPDEMSSQEATPSLLAPAIQVGKAPAVVATQTEVLVDAGRALADAPSPGSGPAPMRLTSAAAAKKQAEIVTERWRSKRRSLLSDEELRRQLQAVPEVRLDAVPGSSKTLLASSKQAAATGVDVVPAFMARRTDLIGFRPRTGNDARMSREEALNLKVLSQHLRLHLETSMPGIKDGVVDPRPDAAILRERLLNNPQRDAWLRPDAIPALRQLLMHEHQNVRQILVEALALIPGPQSTRVLAERALFDLHPEVRLAALVALKGRPARDYEAILVAGFQYPWPVVADLAAEALVALELKEAVPKLIPLLDARNPSEPYPVEMGKKRYTMVPELVRLNHLRNCLLCHLPSYSPLDPIRGPVPNSGHLLPLPSSGTRVAGSGGGGWGGGIKAGKKNFTAALDWVRPDVTYLKQDFSVLQPVAKHGPQWPEEQRFDYLIRLRPLEKKQLVLWQETVPDSRTTSPQREALLFALRELTGEDAGPTAEDWKKVYSPLAGKRLEQPLDTKGQARLLRDGLVEAKPVRQKELLVLYRDRSGPAYDIALVHALPKLTGDLQKLGRKVLADRMQCLPLKELKERLRDKDPEMRRAAARASGLREEKALVPDMIDLLEDAVADVANQAQLALQQITTHDFGPRPGADRDQRLQAIAAWREWWDQQERKRAGS